MAKALRGAAVSGRDGGLLRWMPPLTLGLLVAPLVAGLAGTLLPAFGYLPPLGGTNFTLEPWRRLFDLPGLWTSAELSFATGLITTVVSLVLVSAFCAAWHGTRMFLLLERSLAPLLSVPHVTVAFGIAFLLAPSGWILRLLSPWATGFQQPPDWLIIQDPHALTLMIGLIAKETPFLLIMTLAALGQADAERTRTVARTMGYRPMTGWLKAVFPRVYPQIRLPIFAVLAYGTSVVDVAMVLGPTTPAPLAVRLTRLFNDPDLSQRFVASAGAFLLFGLVVAGLLVWLVGEAVARRLGTRWIISGHRGCDDRMARWASAAALGTTAGAVFIGLLGMAIWSFTESWRFPAALPAELTTANWSRHLPGLAEPLANTLTVAVSTTLLALGLAIGVLEHEARRRRRRVVSAASDPSGVSDLGRSADLQSAVSQDCILQSAGKTGGVRTLSRTADFKSAIWRSSTLRCAECIPTGVFYLPLLIPQIAFLFGAQILLVLAQLDGRWIALTWMHLVFVFPYVFLSLSDPYRAWDQRYQQIGLCLGATPIRVFWRIKLPMLLRAITTAGAVGFAVSLGLYLPTLFAGSGRYPTLTTEAVTLSSSADNRLIGLYSLVQMALPLLGFLLAAMLPAWLFRHRCGMQINR